MKKLYFVRHGLSESNVQGRFSGRTDTPLTGEGRAQAKSTGRRAQKLKIDKIVSSPLSRAYDTAKIIAKEINYPENKIELNPLLVERSFGSIEGKLWSPDINLDGISDIETVENLVLRAGEVLDWLKLLEEDNVLVVAHGSIGRAIRYHIHKVPFADNDRLANAEIVQWI